jgi:hypothetical protein
VPTRAIKSESLQADLSIFAFGKKSKSDEINEINLKITSNSPQVSTFKCNSLNSWIAFSRNFPNYTLYPQIYTLYPQRDTHCTPNENLGVQSKNPKKKIRKSPDFRPDFPSIGKIVHTAFSPWTILAPKKKAMWYKGMWYSYNHPHFHSEVKSV